MAYPFQQEEGLTREQAEVLRELNSFQAVNQSIAWTRIKERLQSDVDEAREDLLGCPAETPLETRGMLSLRWQQREAIQRDLLNFMDSQLEQRTNLVEEIKEQSNEHNPGDPGSDNQ